VVVIDVHQVGLSLAFVIYESANPHMGKPFSTYLQANLDVGFHCNVSNHQLTLTHESLILDILFIALACI